MILTGKHNKHMLKLFLVLLGAVIIISAFGGGIKTQENFWEDNQPENPDKLEEPPKLEESQTLQSLPIPPSSDTNDLVSDLKKEDKVTIEPFQGSMFAGAY
jgi:hypothetical protein